MRLRAEKMRYQAGVSEQALKDLDISGKEKKGAREKDKEKALDSSQVEGDAGPADGASFQGLQLLPLAAPPSVPAAASGQSGGEAPKGIMGASIRQEYPSAAAASAEAAGVASGGQEGLDPLASADQQGSSLLGDQPQ